MLRFHVIITTAVNGHAASMYDFTLSANVKAFMGSSALNYIVMRRREAKWMFLDVKMSHYYFRAPFGAW